MRGRADDAGPNLPEPYISPLVEAVLSLLEEAGCPGAINDQVVQLIEGWEHSLLPRDPDF